jgi:hypothetical protein
VLDFELLRDKGILIVTPHGPLEKADFERVAKDVDLYLADNGMLAGVMFYVKSFPGWDSFAALLAHFKFVKDHQRKIERLAVVSDSDLLKIMPHIVSHFAHPEVKQFPYDEKETALAWLESRG